MDGVERTDDGEEAHVKITRQNARRQIPKETLEEASYGMRVPKLVRTKQVHVSLLSRT
jgi:hypothetical protein